MIRATLEDIRPRFDPQHPADEARVQAILNHLAANDDEWDLPAVIVIDDEGNGYTVLDGHHRLTAAKRAEVPEIPAWIISVADYCGILDRHFGGIAPPRTSDICEHVMCGDVIATEIAKQ